MRLWSWSSRIRGDVPWREDPEERWCFGAHDRRGMRAAQHRSLRRKKMKWGRDNRRLLQMLMATIKMDSQIESCDMWIRFDYGSFYPAEGDASHCFIGEEAGKGYNINVPWEHGKCGDADYIAAWDHVLLPVTEAFDPDIILVSAGFDAALGDPLGGCCITPNGYALLLTKSESEDVDHLFGADSSVNVIQVADDAISEHLSKMKLDEDNITVKTASSCSTAEQHPPGSVVDKDAPVVLSKRISDLSLAWRSDLSRTHVWLEQFNDILFQENCLVLEDGKDGNVVYPDSPLIGSSEIEFMSTNKAIHLEPIKDSWYSNVLYLGEEEELPVLTMTCPSSDIERYKSGELPLAPPSKTYAATLIKGLVEGKKLDADGAANYINAAAARGLEG
nr:unnamed protein product [Digitaria exilis]